MNLLGGEAIEMEQFTVEGCIGFWLDVGKSIAEHAVYLIQKERVVKRCICLPKSTNMKDDFSSINHLSLIQKACSKEHFLYLFLNKIPHLTYSDTLQII